MEFQTDRQIAKIMIAITKRAERARRRPMVTVGSMDSALRKPTKITNGPGPNV
jgi:hypothetical protein